MIPEIYGTEPFLSEKDESTLYLWGLKFHDIGPLYQCVGLINPFFGEDCWQSR